VLVAASIPLMSAVPIPEREFRWLTASFGLLVVIIEEIQQLNQDQQNWIAYRSTCEALKHEKYLHLAGAGPYANTENQDKGLGCLPIVLRGLSRKSMRNGYRRKSKQLRGIWEGAQRRQTKPQRSNPLVRRQISIANSTLLTRPDHGLRSVNSTSVRPYCGTSTEQTSIGGWLSR
jgi:Protein of unknown function (DUF4231)